MGSPYSRDYPPGYRLIPEFLRFLIFRSKYMTLIFAFCWHFRVPAGGCWGQKPGRLDHHYGPFYEVDSSRFSTNGSILGHIFHRNQKGVFYGVHRNRPESEKWNRSPIRAYFGMGEGLFRTRVSPSYQAPAGGTPRGHGSVAVGAEECGRRPLVFGVGKKDI